MAELIQRFKVPLGSLVVDIGLVVYVTFTAGQLVERMEAMNERLVRMEAQQITPLAAQRLAALEERVAAACREEAMNSIAFQRSLERIETKLDEHISASARRNDDG